VEAGVELIVEWTKKECQEKKDEIKMMSIDYQDIDVVMTFEC